ncbi:hypothetical protein ACFO9E_11130 [Streptomyces maoxianensis]|uniref:Uncharacterized protein n=1 Tax=Streptomyces maoxianensis TaxID=1459942 RepID=A0ABV9G2T5_9ACTN
MNQLVEQKMGLWGSLVVANAAVPLSELGVFEGEPRMERFQERASGWQVWLLEREASLDESQLGQLLAATGRPAMFGYVMDSDCVVVEAIDTKTMTWCGCLDRAAMTAYMAENGESVDAWFLSSSEAAERAVGWASDAGYSVPHAPLIEVFEARSDPLAEELFLRLLDRMGLPRELAEV